MELEILEYPDHYLIKVTLALKARGVDGTWTELTAEAELNKASCRNPQTLLLDVQSMASLMVNRLLSRWRHGLVHSIRDAVVTVLAPPAADAATDDAPRQVAAIPIAEWVVPTPPDAQCRHGTIYAPNDGALFGKCTACGDDKVPVVGYAQSAMMAEGFLIKVQ